MMKVSEHSGDMVQGIFQAGVPAGERGKLDVTWNFEGRGAVHFVGPDTLHRDELIVAAELLLKMGLAPNSKAAGSECDLWEIFYERADAPIEVAVDIVDLSAVLGSKDGGENARNCLERIFAASIRVDEPGRRRARLSRFMEKYTVSDGMANVAVDPLRLAAIVRVSLAR